MSPADRPPLSVRPSVPRLHFTGRFLADVSTVNNDPAHYDAANFRPNYHLPYGTDPDANPNGWWNPSGTGTFSLVGCTITKAVYTDATEATHVKEDPAVGLPINDAAYAVQGKLVNLDPVQQDVFEIWGLEVNLGSLRDPPPPPSFRSKLATTACMDTWTKVPTAEATPADPHKLGANAGVWQGILKLSTFDPGDSRFMHQCAPFLHNPASTALAPSGVLVVRMNVDNFCTDSSSDDFPYGRVVGTIRPWVAGDPLFFDADRMLWPLAKNYFKLFNAYAHLEKRDNDYALYLDLGNALTAVSEGGPLTGLGDLKISLLSYGPENAAHREVLFTLTESVYTADDWFENTAGVVQVPLDYGLVERAMTIPLAVHGNDRLLLAEPANGYNVRPDTFVFRMNPGDMKTVTFYVTKFGQRAPGELVSIGFDSSVMKKQTTQGPIPGPQSYGEPKSAVVLGEDSINATQNNRTGNGTGDPAQRIETTITACSNGIATLKLTARNPGNPRRYIDGQVYGLGYGVGPKPPPVGQMNTSQIVNLLLFDEYQVPDNPSWLLHIQPIFLQYAYLYPAMGRIVNLADYASCMTRLYPLAHAFGAPIDDPHYMPVTRDLSEKKKKTILKWIGNPGGPEKPLYMDIHCKHNLMVALQTAIELEHATIPPYLCSLYSIKPGYNQDIADTIRSVVIEEMLHFSTACNILISIGGHPNISKSGFVPKYPGPLPGGLRRGLIARLRKCSIEQLREFMSIEEPRSVVETDDGVVDGKDIKSKKQEEKYTIGFLYDQIKASLIALHESGNITFGNEGLQIEGWANPGDLRKILSLEDAIWGINQIEEQGEGGRPLEKHPGLNPTDGDIDEETGLPELAHYYKFAEIVYGKKIVIERNNKKGEPRSFSYSGDPITLDMDGVYPMMDDPDVATLPKGSQQRNKAEGFSRKYRAVLNALHRTFNGDPGYVKQAIAAMFQLTIFAEPLMQLDSGRGDDTTVGLSFQLPSDS